MLYVAKRNIIYLPKANYRLDDKDKIKVLPLFRSRSIAYVNTRQSRFEKNHLILPTLTIHSYFAFSIASMRGSRLPERKRTIAPPAVQT